jgi:hypothetical protein
MNKKTIKSFYLSLIDNPDAKWTYEKNSDWGLYHCNIGNIKITSHPNFLLTFTHTDESLGSPFDSRRLTSEKVSFSEIGISKLRLWFPYFGICAKLDRRINKEEQGKDTNQQDYKMNSIFNVLKKDKALVRDTKIDELLK